MYFAGECIVAGGSRWVVGGEDETFGLLVEGELFVVWEVFSFGDELGEFAGGDFEVVV